MWAGGAVNSRRKLIGPVPTPPVVGRLPLLEQACPSLLLVSAPPLTWLCVREQVPFHLWASVPLFVRWWVMGGNGTRSSLRVFSAAVV